MAGTSVQASSAEPTDVLDLADDTQLRLRPLGSEDRDGLAALFARLSPESRYRRFLSPKRELTPRELEYLTDIDHIHHDAFAAIDQRDGSIVGVGRYAHVADRPDVADIAVEVTDELQNMGIGTALARRTVQRARDNGFALLTATTLSENRPARALLRRFEFRALARHGCEIELELKLDPPSDGPKSTPAIEHSSPQTNPWEDIVSTIEHPAEIDGDKREQVVFRAVDEVGDPECSATDVDVKLGPHRAPPAAGGLSSAEPAERTGTAERYVREWLSTQAAGGYIEYDPDRVR